MKIMVTGGAGYIGSHTISELIIEGYDVVVVDDLSTGFIESIQNSVQQNKIQFEKGSILDWSWLDQVFKKHSVDGIIHFAAKLVVPESIERPVLYYENNVIGTLNILKMCEKYKVNKFVFSSTAAVYGNTSQKTVREDDLASPINPYGETKLCVEKMLKHFSIQHADFKYVILRYFNVAGAALDRSNGQRTLNATHLIKVACEAALNKRSEICVYGNDYDTIDGTGVRDYIHVVDLASAHASAIKYLKQTANNSVILNCGYGRGFSVLQVIEMIKKISGLNFKTVIKERRNGDPAAVVADSHKVLEVLNWKPKFNDLEIICRTAFDWEKTRP